MTQVTVEEMKVLWASCTRCIECVSYRKKKKKTPKISHLTVTVDKCPSDSLFVSNFYIAKVSNLWLSSKNA